MILQSLTAEFEHEVNSTRKLLRALPEKDLGYKPSPISWTMGELAQHIATIYYWYAGTLTKDVYDIPAVRDVSSDYFKVIDFYYNSFYLSP